MTCLFLLALATSQTATNQTLIVTPMVGSPMTVEIDSYDPPQHQVAPVGPHGRSTQATEPEVLTVTFPVTTQNERLRTFLGQHRPLKSVMISLNRVLKIGTRPYKQINFASPVTKTGAQSGLTYTVTFSYKAVSEHTLS